MSALFNGQTST